MARSLQEIPHGIGTPAYGKAYPDSRSSTLWLDRFLALAFAVFALTSATIDAYLALGIRFDAQSENPVIRIIYSLYVEGNDFLLMENPLFLRVQAGISAFVFGPFYVLLAYCLLRRRNWIRIPALMYVASMVYGMAIVLCVQFMGERPPGDLLVFSLGTLPYLLIPLLLGWRMAGPMPFGRGRG